VFSHRESFFTSHFRYDAHSILLGGGDNLIGMESMARFFAAVGPGYFSASDRLWLGGIERCDQSGFFACSAGDLKRDGAGDAVVGAFRGNAFKHSFDSSDATAGGAAIALSPLAPPALMATVSADKDSICITPCGPFPRAPLIVATHDFQHDQLAIIIINGGGKWRMSFGRDR
jgi:hypothetical protein